MATHEARPAWLDEMRAESQRLRDREGSEPRWWSLYGKRAIVAPGEKIRMRLLPRPSVANQYIRTPDGKVVRNPKYVPEKIWVKAYEHWFQSGDRRVHAWCLRMSEAGRCYICEQSELLRNSPNEHDRELGYDLRAREVFIFAAAVGKPGARKMRSDGRPDFRLVPFPGTVFAALADIMAGDESEGLARGDISDFRTGRDIIVTRPAGQGSRWAVRECDPSPLFLPEEREAWADWITLIPDIAGIVQSELVTYDRMKALYEGVSDEDVALPSPAPETPPVAPDPAPDAVAGTDDDEVPFSVPELPEGEEIEDVWDGLGTEAAPSRPVPPPARRPQGRRG